MASLEIKIQPLPVPETVKIKIPGSEELVEIPVEDLDESTITELIEEFTTSFLKRAGIE